MFVIVTKYLIPKGYNGLTLFTFVVVRTDSDKGNKVLVNHERIHIKQQIQLLVLPFLIWYMIVVLVQVVLGSHLSCNMSITEAAVILIGFIATVYP